MANSYSRREFLRFMGAQTAAATVFSATLPSCISKPLQTRGAFSHAPIPSRPGAGDELVLVEGLSYQVLIAWGDPINDRGESFGFNNDFIAVLADPERPGEAFLWVNHETPSFFFVSGYREGMERTREQVVLEQKSVGGSILRIKREGRRGWRLHTGHPGNRRIDATTPIPLIAERPVYGHKTAIGTLSNCAGGVTPWGTILTCEENYEKFYGEIQFEQGRRLVKPGPSAYGWESFFPRPPEHYGWVVEVNPHSGACKKLTALGRFSHECATTIEAADGRCVVYSGDDREGGRLYKFVASRPGALERGSLFAANLERRRWLPLSMTDNPALRERFLDHTDLLVRAREAAELAGATPLDRPEDIEIDPRTGAVFVALTNNKHQNNYYGSILKLREKDNDPTGLEFEWETFLMGGLENGFACPDNMVFDRHGNLWMTSDIAENELNAGPYEGFGNNGLFYIPLHGPLAGGVYRFATAPNEAEFTGPCFSPDQRTLFLSVQHPGSRSTARGYTSHWPDGGNRAPRPGVITISGPLLDSLTG